MSHDRKPHVVFSLGEAETFELGRALGTRLRGGELILLIGELGLGKTVFARGIAVALGVAEREVSSPSFTLVQEYRGDRLTMFHVDLYRVADREGIETIGLEDLVSGDNICVVEWGERLPGRFRQEAVIVRFHDLGEDSRRIELGASSHGLETTADA